MGFSPGFEHLPVGLKVKNFQRPLGTARTLPNSYTRSGDCCSRHLRLLAGWETKKASRKNLFLARDSPLVGNEIPFPSAGRASLLTYSSLI